MCVWAGLGSAHAYQRAVVCVTADIAQSCRVHADQPIPRAAGSAACFAVLCVVVSLLCPVVLPLYNSLSVVAAVIAPPSCRHPP